MVTVDLKFVIFHSQESDHYSAQTKGQLWKQPFQCALGNFPEQLFYPATVNSFYNCIHRRYSGEKLIFKINWKNTRVALKAYSKDKTAMLVDIILVTLLLPLKILSTLA